MTACGINVALFYAEKFQDTSSFSFPLFACKQQRRVSYSEIEINSRLRFHRVARLHFLQFHLSYAFLSARNIKR